MELIVPILEASAAFFLLIFGLVIKYMTDADELFYIVSILSTIFFFVAGACFLGVTYLDPTTGAMIQTTDYNWLVWLMVPFGFIPILMMFEQGFDTSEGE